MANATNGRPGLFPFSELVRRRFGLPMWPEPVIRWPMPIAAVSSADHRLGLARE